jgi:serine/threonine protein kinase
VFQAHDEHLDRDVAIKVFRAPPSEDDPLFSTARRDAELQSLARLNHPNLIRLLDGSVSPDEPAYLVLDLVCGPDLATKLHEGPLPEREVRAIGAQIAGALDYAHGLGMVHRDVKPANILLGSDGPDGGVWARLSDFGTVRMLDSARLTAADLTLGTASYIAPEQARGADVGPGADVYSLGLVLIEALTGERCFAGTTPEALVARLASSPVIPDWLPADLAALLTAMTALEPERRPSAAEVAECLRAPGPAQAMALLPESVVEADAGAVTAPHAVVPPVAVVAAAADAPPPPVVVPPDEPVRRTRHRGGVLVALAGVAFAAMISGAAFLIMGNAAPSSNETPLVPRHVAGPTHSAQHHSQAAKDAGAQIVTEPSNAPAGRKSTHVAGPRHTAAPPANRPAPAGPRQNAPSSSASVSASPSVSSSSPPPTSTSPAPPTSTSPAPSTSDTSTALAEPSP